MTRALALALTVALYASGVHARDLNGAHANDPLKPWFDTLSDHFGTSCCADADGATVKDVDWSATAEGLKCQHTPAISYNSEEASSYAGHYCVRYKNAWWLVPDSATLEQPNRFGPAIIWPICQSSAHVSGADACNDDGSTLFFIRCFLPGAGT